MKKFEYTPPEQPRELILKLGQKITDRIGHTVTAEDPEYYGLEALVTDEMAEVALKMKVRKPMTLAQIVKATGKEEKVLEELLQEMSNIGLLDTTGKIQSMRNSMFFRCMYREVQSSLI